MNKLILLFILVLPVTVSAQSGKNIDVLHYVFSLRLSDKNDSLNGEAGIRFRAVNETAELLLDLKSRGRDNKGMQVISVEQEGRKLNFTHARDILSIQLPVKMNQNDSQEVRVRFAGIPANGLIISKNKYGSRTFFSDNWPNRAHHWLPVVDHPSDKASVEFIITAPSYYQVISNGTVAEETDLGNAMRLTHYKEKTPLPTKIMVIGVARFAVQRWNDTLGIEQQSWVYPENREAGFYDYDQTREILPFFIDYIGPFAYDKLAHIQSKTMFGGMENAGAIFYSESSVTGNRQHEDLLAHEIAHQWFGNMVTETDFSHLWLSEGFATYLTNIYLEKKYGRHKHYSLLKEQKDAVSAFLAASSRPVVDTQSNYMALLNANSYQKGAWILHMLRMEVGDELFRKIIQQFYSDYHGRNANSEDFENLVESLTGRNFDQFFRQWLYYPHIPRLEFKWEYDSNTREVIINIKQLTRDIYSIPVYIQFKNQAGESPIQKMELNQKEQSFRFQVKQKPVELVFDPEFNTLAQVNWAN